MPNWYNFLVQNSKPQADTSLDSEYGARYSEAIAKAVHDSDKFVMRTMQEHHDYFVQKFLDAETNGVELDKKDMEEYQLAMLRERKGIVYPLNR